MKLGCANDTFYLTENVLRGFPDIRITCFNENTSYSLNKSVLAAFSPMLKTALVNTVSEDVVLITDLPSAHIIKIINSLTTGRLYPNSDDVWSSFDALHLQIPKSDQEEKESSEMGVRQISCPHCPLIFTSSSEFRSHAEEFSVFQCVNCGLLCRSENHWNKHRSLTNPHHVDPHCNYKDCPSRFNSYAEHKEHINEIHDGKVLWKCGLCGSVFDSKNLMDLHRRRKSHVSSSSEKTDWKVCELCGYSNKNSLTYHSQDVHGSILSPCSSCDKVFNHPESLSRHVKSAHVEYPCEPCRKTFKSVYSYKDHVKVIHTPDEEKPFKCEICCRGFTREKFLEEHMNRHTNDRPYKCHHCSDAFRSLSTRTCHEKAIHLGIKRKKLIPKGIVCEHCGKVLRTRSHHYDHIINNHTSNEDKPFKCKICNLGFPRQNYVDEHMNIHTGATPFTCKFCGMGFKSSSTRYHHQNAVHRGIKRGAKKDSS